MKTISRLTSATTEWRKKKFNFKILISVFSIRKKMEFQTNISTVSTIPALVQMIYQFLVFGGWGCTTNNNNNNNNNNKKIKKVDEKYK